MSSRPIQLASFREFCNRIQSHWPQFLDKRNQWLLQGVRFGHAAEKVAESILADFFTVPLNWQISDLNHQVGYADILLTKMGIKRLVVEAKRPDSLALDQPSLERALGQARRYADEQQVPSIAVSDGTLFCAADIVNGGLRRRAQFRLDQASLSLDAFWLSVDGIYRNPERLDEDRAEVPTCSSDAEEAEKGVSVPEIAPLLHHGYKLPAECFAYVEDARKPQTWKLPYRLANGEVDEKRLPGAIRSVISNYRGTRVDIPEKAVPDVLVRLGRGAVEARKMPGQLANPPETYQKLYDTLRQIARLEEVFPAESS